MTIAFLIGRVILGLYWLHTAYGHIFKASGMLGYAQSKGIKSAGTAKLAVIGTGILALLGGFSILAGYRPELGIACLVVFLIGVSSKMHPYWKETDPMAKMGERVNFWKNMALLGALLAMLAIPLPWMYALVW
jgi:uncharacterized membrane protein YphA (DoxX/SURF4 family)